MVRSIPLAVAILTVMCSGRVSAYLHPQLGRFLQRDPAKYIDAASLYCYLISTPTNKLDPTGNQATTQGAPYLVLRPGEFFASLGPQGTGGLGGAVGLGSSIEIHYYPSEDDTKCCDEIRFIQIVETRYQGDTFAWHTDDKESTEPPYYALGTPRQLPWKKFDGPKSNSRIYERAEMSDQPGQNTSPWVIQMFETAAVCAKGQAKGRILGVLYWGHDLKTTYAKRWISKDGPISWIETPPGSGNWQQNGTGYVKEGPYPGDVVRFFPRGPGGSPSSRFATTVGTF